MLTIKDNIPLRDPAELFEGLEYTHSGSVFWPDLYKDHPDNAIFRVLGKTCSDTHWPAEAGKSICYYGRPDDFRPGCV